MRRLSLDFHGVSACVESTAEEALEPLARDFAYFAVNHTQHSRPTIRWTLYPSSPPKAPLPKGLPTFRTRFYTARDSGPARWVDYQGLALSIYDSEGCSGTIHCRDPVLLHELSYLAVLSRVGDALDRRGIHRAHALGFEHQGSGGLLLLPAGGGKSTLALEMLRSSGMGIIGEDTVLVTRDLRLLAFPLRWGFAQDADLSGVPERMIRPFHRRRHGRKRLVDVAFFRARIRDDVPLRWLIIGKRRPGPAGLAPCPKPAAWAALGMGLVLGRGLAQMAEYTLRPDLRAAAALAGIAHSRARTALAMLTRSTKRFGLGDSPGGNLSSLLDFLDHPPVARPGAGTMPGEGG